MPVLMSRCYISIMTEISGVSQEDSRNIWNSDLYFYKTCDKEDLSDKKWLEVTQIQVFCVDDASMC